MQRRRAFVTGITGQDGSYLTELLLAKGYEVYGLVRRVSTDPFVRLEHVRQNQSLHFVYGNVRDLNAVRNALREANPHEVYNLAAQSHVGVSFLCPEETLEVDSFGVGRVVTEALELNPKVRIYQASTSEMFGSSPPPQNEHSLFNPVSPYGQAKLRAHEDFVIGYRTRHNLFICSGILFNHESPRRGKHFVTKKITHSLVKIKLGLQDYFELGNLDAKRDWGYAPDYVEAMWKILQQPTPDDYVIATGASHSVREFVEVAAAALEMEIHWSGTGEHEVGRDSRGKVIVKVNKEFYRPHEVSTLRGDSTKARQVLGWEPAVSFNELVRLMVEGDLRDLQNQTKKH